eukprot:SAG25_NODE_556_length_6947_cov_7.702242_5_plen_63_part_00
MALLLDHLADPMLCDEHGASALHRAVVGGHQKVTDMLLGAISRAGGDKSAKLLAKYKEKDLF